MSVLTSLRHLDANEQQLDFPVLYASGRAAGQMRSWTGRARIFLPCSS